MIRYFWLSLLVFTFSSCSSLTSNPSVPTNASISKLPLYPRYSGFGSTEKRKSYFTSVVNIFYSLPMVHKAIYEEAVKMRSSNNCNPATLLLAYKLASMRMVPGIVLLDSEMMKAFEMMTKVDIRSKAGLFVSDFLDLFVKAQTSKISSLFKFKVDAMDGFGELEKTLITVPLKPCMSISDLFSFYLKIRVTSPPEVLSLYLKRIEIVGQGSARKLNIHRNEVKFDREIVVGEITFVFAGNVQCDFRNIEFYARAVDFGNDRIYKYSIDGTVVSETQDFDSTDQCSILVFYVRKESIMNLKAADGAAAMAIRSNYDIPQFISETYNNRINSENSNSYSIKKRRLGTEFEGEVINLVDDEVVDSQNINLVGNEVADSQNIKLVDKDVTDSPVIDTQLGEIFSSSSNISHDVSSNPQPVTSDFNPSFPFQLAPGASHNSLDRLPQNAKDIISRLNNPNFQLGSEEYSFRRSAGDKYYTAFEIVLSCMASSTRVYNFYIELLKNYNNRSRFNVLVGKALTEMLLGMNDISIDDLMKEFYKSRVLTMDSVYSPINDNHMMMIVTRVMDCIPSGIFDKVTISSIQYDGMESDDVTKICHNLKYTSLITRNIVPIRPAVFDGLFTDSSDGFNEVRIRTVFKSSALILPIRLFRFELSRNGVGALSPQPFHCSSYPYALTGMACYDEENLETFKASFLNMPHERIRKIKPGQSSTSAPTASPEFASEFTRDFSLYSFYLFFAKRHEEDTKMLLSSDILEIIRMEIINDLISKSK